jgi:8-oxo-dGTP pyrophosphatase MutT (NUDIX family)
MIDETGLKTDGSVLPIRSYRLAVLPGVHPLEEARREAVAENWVTEHAANPSLFDGRMILQHRIRLNGATIEAEGYLSSFSTFLWWRKQQDRSGACHLFGYPVLVSADNALIAVEMAPHTANAGQVYFAAGSLDASDVVDGHCDLAGNMRREVQEETGLDLSHASTDGTVYASYRPHRLTFFQLFQFDATAEELIARIDAFAANAHEQEISRAVAIRNRDPGAYRYNPAMLPIIDWYFARRP